MATTTDMQVIHLKIMKWQRHNFNQYFPKYVCVRRLQCCHWFDYPVTRIHHLLWCRNTSLRNWLKKLAPVCHPIRSKNPNQRRDSLAQMCPRLLDCLGVKTLLRLVKLYARSCMASFSQKSLFISVSVAKH